MYSEPEWVKEVARKGELIYQERIKHLVDPIHLGKFLVVDVETGDYEIGERMKIASKKLRERKPEAITYGVRVGFLSAYRWGGRNYISGNDDRNS